MDQRVYASPAPAEPACDCIDQGPAPALACEECVQQCADEPCVVGLTPECTDQCHVVTCTDAHHEAVVCVDPHLSEPCVADCPDGAPCSSLEDFFLCCTEDHDYLPDTQIYPVLSHMSTSHNFSFDASIEAFLCGCAPHSDHICSQSAIPAIPQAMPSSSSMSTTPDSLTDASPSPALSEAIAAQMSHDYYNHPQQQPTYQQSPQQHSQQQHPYQQPLPTYYQQPSDSPQQNHFQQPPQLSFSPSQPQRRQQNLPAAVFLCRWADCLATFSSENELVGHVVLQHLRLPTSHQPQYPAPPQQQMAPTMDAAALACLWADCNVFPTAASIPGPSSAGGTIDAALGVLHTHLLEHHLGIPARTSPTLASLTLASAPASRASTPVERGPTTPTPEHDCAAASAHACLWHGCGRTFGACAELTAHIAAEHVGGGRAHYDCRWGDCARNGDAGFASKQKILRHLQSHTGHRPFQCKTCGQNFSEAATLAQHMRRHTQEKPYVCDHPGCGKAFAITGALTIHKRTHNGDKPFKCTYCDRAFAESSNLSKHLRTHTGARPYPCTEPGCNKSFARPDQLTRHTNVHRKKSVEATGERTAGEVSMVATAT